MSEDNTITTLPVWGPGYEISFEFNLHSEGPSQYHWIFGVRHDTLGGFGQPAVYFKNKRLTIWFQRNGENIYYVSSKRVRTGRWNTLTISSIKENGVVSQRESM